MAEIINRDSKVPKSTSSRSMLGRLGRSKKFIRLLILIMAAALLALVVYAYLRKADKYSYTYHNLTTTQIKMSATADTIATSALVSLQKPAEFALTAVPADQLARAYQHNFKGQPIANLFIQTDTFTGNFAKVVEPSLAASFKQSPANRDYQSYVAPLNDYIRGRLPSGYQFNLGTAQAFTNGSIKSGAWQFDFTASAKTDPKAYQKWQGKLLYIWTDSHTYLILLDSIQQNWQPNMRTWQVMIDSVKVE